MKKLSLVVLFICSISFSQEWRVPMKEYHYRSGEIDSTYLLAFGVHPDATDGFDRDLDTAAPPLAPTYTFAWYLACDDRLVTMLLEDTRNADLDTIVWEINYVIGSPPPDSFHFLWDASLIPSGWEVELTFVPVTARALDDNIEWDEAINISSESSKSVPTIDMYGKYIATRAIRGSSKINEAKPEAFAVHVSPNPFNSVCNILTEPGAEIIISDITGKTIQSNKLPDNTSNYSWQAGNNLPSGVYNISVISENSTVSRKVTYIK